MTKFVLNINRVCQWSGTVLSYVILVITGIVVLDVVLRYFAHRPSFWGLEVSVFSYGVYFMLTGAYLVSVKAHVSVDIIYNHLSFRNRKILDIIASLAIVFTAAALVWFGGRIAWRSFQMLETSGVTIFNPPIWWFRGIVPLAGVLLGLQAFANMVVAIQDLVGHRGLER